MSNQPSTTDSKEDEKLSRQIDDAIQDNLIVGCKGTDFVIDEIESIITHRVEQERTKLLNELLSEIPEKRHTTKENPGAATAMPSETLGYNTALQDLTDLIKRKRQS